jgi:hypothetical protein
MNGTFEARDDFRDDNRITKGVYYRHGISP